jgi:hypothetical protein
MISILSFLLSTSLLICRSDGRPIDLDNNGVPDLCTTALDGLTQCLLDDKWTKVPSTVLPIITTTSRPAASVTTTASSFSTPSLQPLLPSGVLPSSTDVFKADKGTKWHIDYVGDLQFTGELGAKDLVGDKCRSGVIGDKVIWNCGDMICGTDLTTCGFSMGPAFYGTDSVMTVDASGPRHVEENDFLRAWYADSPPELPQTHFGMDTSNVVPINDTHGVAYARQIWRGAEDGSYVDQGNAVASITLGDTKPIATRIGALLTGPDDVEMGLLAILRDAEYIYIYSLGGPSKLVVSRVAATDDVFDIAKYESLEFSSNNTWSAGIPTLTDTKFGMLTSNTDGQFGCAVYGSVFYNNFLNKYTIICNTMMTFTNMYTSDTPYGPWSAEYPLLELPGSYASHAHPHFSPGGSHKEFYFSLGPNSKFHMYKVSFGYD